MEHSINRLLESVTHPYARYGLAVICSRADFRDTPDCDGLRKSAIGALNAGMESFRIKTSDDPSTASELHFKAINSIDLLSDERLIQSSGLANNGIYIFPSVLTTDGGAKMTFGAAIALREALASGVDFKQKEFLQRSFAPTVAKFNSGKASMTVPWGTLLEAVCSAVATLTPDKPSALTGGTNTAILPDLNKEELIAFIQVFTAMRSSKTVSLLTVVPRIDAKTGKAGYRRPPIFNGNYPNAPRDADTFGAVGLLAAIGEWAKIAEEEQRTKALAVLESLADCPLYIVSYDGISQARFSHHIVGLAKMARLCKIVNDLYFSTRFYADADAVRLNRDDNNYQLFYKMASRFLQSFDTPSLRDFLSFRTEYAPSLKALWSIYFMEKQNIPEPIVSAARALGQWINYAAYRTAADENEGKPDAKKRIKQDKAKILAEFESAVFSAKDSSDLLSRVSIRAGRLLGQDAPYDAQAFYDATLMETIKLPQAQQMLVAYMRLRSAYTKSVEADDSLDVIAMDVPTMSSTEESMSEEMTQE